MPEADVDNPARHYQALARAAASVCGVDFERAEIVAQLDEGYAEIVYRCERAGGPYQAVDSSFEDDSAVNAALHALRADSVGSEKWSRATFILVRDGSFTFDVGHADPACDRPATTDS